MEENKRVDSNTDDLQIPSSRDEAFKKASDVIASCQTREHANTARKYVDRCIMIHGGGTEADRIRSELADLYGRLPPDVKEKG